MIDLTELGLFVLRVFAGAAILTHGIPKLLNFKGTMKWLGSEGFPLPVVSTLAVVVAEALGGVMLILGVFTVWAATILAINMFVATLFHLRKGNKWKEMEDAVLYLAIFIVIALAGPGVWTILG